MVMGNRFSDLNYNELINHLSLIKNKFYIIDSDFFSVASDVLRKEVISNPYWIFPTGEKNKNINVFKQCCEDLAIQGVSRHTHIIAVGGGVVNDFAGFVAASLYRGMKWSNIPTSVMAQIDASIGGKVGINLEAGKNLVGSFHFPEMTFFCSSLLETLPKSEIANGHGELMKYAFLSKEINDLVLSGKSKTEIYLACAKYKESIILKDSHEKGLRKVLNLGHTLGHAFEIQYKIPHGLAVLAGLNWILKFSPISNGEERFNQCLNILSLKSPDSYRVTEETKALVKRDKKKRSNEEIDLIVLEEIGKPVVRTYKFDDLWK